PRIWRSIDHFAVRRSVLPGLSRSCRAEPLAAAALPVWQKPALGHARCDHVLPDYLLRSAAFSRPSDSAHALATAEFGSMLPGIVAQPPFSTNLPWSHA